MKLGLTMTYSFASKFARWRLQPSSSPQSIPSPTPPWRPAAALADRTRIVAPRPPWPPPPRRRYSHRYRRIFASSVPITPTHDTTPSAPSNASKRVPRARRVRQILRSLDAPSTEAPDLDTDVTAHPRSRRRAHTREPTIRSHRRRQPFVHRRSPSREAPRARARSSVHRARERTSSRIRASRRRRR